MPFLAAKKKCCCKPGECRLTLESRDPCNSNALVGGVTLYIYDTSTNLLLLVLTTDLDGKVETNEIPDGLDLYAQSEKDGYAGGSAVFRFECGTSHVVPIASTVKRITVRGCAGLALEGAVVAITRGSYSLSHTTGASGQFSWYAGAGTGTYSVSISHPSGRFNPLSTTINVTSVCVAQPVSYTLTVAAGHLCCGTTLRNSPLPVKLPLIVTSAGGAFSINLCSGVGCVSVGGCTARLFANLNENSVTGNQQVYAVGTDPPVCRGRECTGNNWSGPVPEGWVPWNDSSVGFTLNSASPFNATVSFSGDAPSIIGSFTLSESP